MYKTFLMKICKYQKIHRSNPVTNNITMTVTRKTGGSSMKKAPEKTSGLFVYNGVQDFYSAITSNGISTETSL